MTKEQEPPRRPGILPSNVGGPTDSSHPAIVERGTPIPPTTGKGLVEDRNAADILRVLQAQELVKEGVTRAPAQPSEEPVSTSRSSGTSRARGKFPPKNESELVIWQTATGTRWPMPCMVLRLDEDTSTFVPEIVDPPRYIELWEKRALAFQQRNIPLPNGMPDIALAKKMIRG